MAAAVTIENKLATFISTALTVPVSQNVLTRARCHLLDTLVSILSGRFLPAGEFGYRFAGEQSQGDTATLLGSQKRVGTELAAFANAMAAHADETDDSHIGGRFHPGCAIVPAALAVAEETNSNSDELLKAIILGYDIGARSTIALGFSSPKTSVFSTHSFAALFGAAAAAGALYRLTTNQTMALLSLTVQQASGLSYWNRDPNHVEKSFDFGAKAARNGVFAAQLARAGMTAPDSPITGPNGYLQAFAENARAEALVENLGNRYEIEHSTIKKWSVGSPIQSVLDAIESLFGNSSVSIDEVESVKIQIPSDRFHIVDDRDIPSICCQHLVALALTDGKVRFDSSHDQKRMKSNDILAWRKKILLLPDDQLSEARPERQAIVTVEMTNGNTNRFHAKAVRGTPENPMPPDEVITKAIDILSCVQADKGQLLVDTCFKESFSIQKLVYAALVNDVRHNLLSKEVPVWA